MGARCERADAHRMRRSAALACLQDRNRVVSVNSPYAIPVHIMNSAPAARVQSVSKAVRLLTHIAEREPSTAREAAEAVGISVTATHHLLHTLSQEGMVQKDHQRRYHLGPRMGALSDAFLRQLAGSDFLVPHMRGLVARTGETAHLAAWRHGDVVILASIEGNHPVRVAGLHTGTQGDAHARASGKVLLAFADRDDAEAYLLRNRSLAACTPHTITDPERFAAELQQVRLAGFATDEQEFRLGVGCVAAPITGAGATIASFSLAVPWPRFRSRREELVTAVREAAAGASTSA